MDNEVAKANGDKGEKAEEKFKEWLDKHKIPYLHISQNKETFASAFKEESVMKRPDFMILLPNLGFIFIEVKDRKINKNYGTFPLDSAETKKYSRLQRKFNLHVWYALSNEDYNYKTWFWTPVSKVLEDGDSQNQEFESSKSHEDFFAIPASDFIQIAEGDSLDRLFSKCFTEDKS
jgi:hypothetical protein